MKGNDNCTSVLRWKNPAPCIGTEAAVHVQHLPAGFTMKHSQILQRRKAALPGSAASFAATNAPRPPRSTGTRVLCKRLTAIRVKAKDERVPAEKCVCQESASHLKSTSATIDPSDHLNCQSMLVPCISKGCKSPKASLAAIVDFPCWGPCLDDEQQRFQQRLRCQVGAHQPPRI